MVLAGHGAVDYRPLSASDDHFACWQLVRDPAQVRHARDQARKALAGWGLAEHADLAALIISELVTNAIVHGHDPIWMRLTAGTTSLLIEVHDGSNARPTRKHPDTGDESGRGLELIDTLTGLHGGQRGLTTDPAKPGKTIHVTLPLTPALQDPH
jgi:anti-sigma regulatory factor (Ser/Thr protein kinase)